jgi:hypothetical protein
MIDPRGHDPSPHLWAWAAVVLQPMIMHDTPEATSVPKIDRRNTLQIND